MAMKKIAYLIREVTPHWMRVFLMQAGQFFAPSRFHQVSDIPFPSLSGILWCLKSVGYTPQFVVDIGAYHGDWTREFKKIYPAAEVLMLDAQERKRAVLERLCADIGDTARCQIALLGATSGAKVNFAEMETGSSVYEELSSVDRTTIEKTVVSLDDLLKDGKHPVDLLKLDVQGYELEVLHGATQAMKQAQFVLLEVSVLPYNKGAPLIGDVIQFMSEHQFRIFDFSGQTRRSNGFLQQTDILFAREGSIYLK